MLRTRRSLLVLLAAASTSLAARVDVGVDTMLMNGCMYLQGQYLLQEYSSFTPKAVWHNLGDTATSFTAFFAMTDPYGSRTYCESMAMDGLAPDSVGTLAFPQYTFWRTGYWTLRCSTAAVGDANPTNDTLRCLLAVYRF